MEGKKSFPISVNTEMYGGKKPCPISVNTEMYGGNKSCPISVYTEMYGGKKKIMHNFRIYRNVWGKKNHAQFP